MYFPAFPLEHGDDLVQRSLVLLEEVGHDDGHASADSGHAVNQHIAFLPSLFDEVKSLIEVFINLIFLMVLGRNVEIVWDLFLTVVKVSTPRHRDNRLDVHRCIVKEIPCKRLRSSAA